MPREKIHGVRRGLYQEGMPKNHSHVKVIWKRGYEESNWQEVTKDTAGEQEMWCHRNQGAKRF